jgi:predicted O-methyltransferase YrrM
MNPEVLASHYEACREKSSDMGHFLPILGETVRATISDYRFPIIVELGVRYGVSTIGFLYTLHRLGGGHLWSVDCSFPTTDPETELDLINPQGPLGVCPNWTFILGYDTWSSTLETLPKKDIDVLLIDTNHLYEETLFELGTYYPRMKPGGTILLHDTALEETGNATSAQPSFPVLTAMTEFCRNHDLNSTNIGQWPGLGSGSV